MPPDTDEFAGQEREDSAARVARRMKREDRRRAERRRAALLTLSLAAAGVLLLAVGLSVAAATRDGRAAGSESVQRSFSVVAESPRSETPSSAMSSVVASVPAAQAADVPRPQAATASKATAVQKSTKLARTPTKKTAVSKPPQAGILIRKCGGSGCHSAAEISEARIDRSSAIDAIEAMVQAGRVKLTSNERAAVIAALTGK